MGGRQRAKRTKDELFNRRKDVHAHGNLKLVNLELKPLAECLEVGRHDGRLCSSCLGVCVCMCVYSEKAGIESFEKNRCGFAIDRSMGMEFDRSRFGVCGFATTASDAIRERRYITDELQKVQVRLMMIKKPVKVN